MMRDIFAAAAAFWILSWCMPGEAVSAWEPYFHEDQLVYDSGSSINQVEVYPAGDGGYYYVWVDYGGSRNSIRAQKLDAHGVAQWDQNGVILLGGTQSFSSYDAVVVGTGDLWVVGPTAVAGITRLRTQRVGADGIPAFAVTGVDLVPSASTHVRFPEVVEDGSGGIVVVFVDSRFFDTTGYDLWAQRISPDGTLLWSGWGSLVVWAADHQTGPHIVSGGDGTSLIFWNDDRDKAVTGQDIWGQKLDADGDPLWDAAGVPITQEMGTQDLQSAASDDREGAILGWVSVSGSDVEVWAQRIDPEDGGNLWGYFGADILVCDFGGHRHSVQVLGDRSGGAYVLWGDDRVDFDDDDDTIYAQHLSPSANPAWNENGRIVFLRSGYQGVSSGGMAVTDAGELLVTAYWQNQALATKLSGDGTQLWSTTGLVVSSWASRAGNPRLCPTPDGGAVVAWDLRYETVDFGRVATQRIDSWGLGGDPAPFLKTVEDRPNDQGGEVVASWNPSAHDAAESPVMDSYSLWMRQPLGAAKARMVTPERVTAVGEASGLSEEPVSVLLETGWAWVGTEQALRFDLYGMIAPTFGDSTSAGVPLTEYQVVAHDDETGGFWVSNVAAGYSVDNLAPAAPLALSGVASGADVDLDWSSSGEVEGDLAGYRIYRSPTPGVDPETAELLATVPDLVFTDASAPAGPKHYVVTAVDVHGNQSAPSNEVQVNGATSVEDAGLPEVFALRGATPNPFNPMTEIRLDVPHSARVRVELYDARGSRVRTLHDGALAAGSRILTWRGLDDEGRSLPSGVYLARATVADKTTTLKLTLAR